MPPGVKTKTRPTRSAFARRIPFPGSAILPRSFYDRPTLVVAGELLGKVLVCHGRRGATAGMIVEVEAYIGESDPACHAAPGRTRRNAPLYGPPGFAYVYLNYGIHYLVNAVTESEGRPAAVLIRALHPLDGIAAMRKRRAQDGRDVDDTALCRASASASEPTGPGAAGSRTTRRYPWAQAAPR